MYKQGESPQDLKEENYHILFHSLSTTKTKHTKCTKYGQYLPQFWFQGTLEPNYAMS